MNLNPEQQKAVNHINGPCVVTSVPGSGKTRALTYRVINLLKHQIDPYNLLCLTFTNKAAEEMRSRIYEQTGEMSKKIWIGTFHSLCVAILRKYGDRVGLSSSFSIYDDKDQLSLIEKIARMKGMDSNSYYSRSLAELINNWRESMPDHEHFPADNSADNEILQEYLKTLDEFNAVDFSGLLDKTWMLLNDHQDVADMLSRRFKYISVDEAQDTNAIQYAIVNKLGSHGNVFIVGDIHQCIFSWRAARPENMEQFKKDFSNVNSITLHRNYRSKANILTASQKLIRHNSNASDVMLKAEKGLGGIVDVKSYYNPDIEAQQVARTIKKLKYERNFKWSDFAVLYRINSMSQPIEVMFKKEHIPYKIIGGFSFFDRLEIKNALSYLSLLTNPHDTIAFSRAIQSPKRGIADVVIGKIEKLCKDKHLSIFDAIKTNEIELNSKQKIELNKFVNLFDKYKNQQNMLDIASGLLKDSGFYDYIQKISKEDLDYQKRSDNINELLVSINSYFTDNSTKTLTDYLQNISLLASNTEEDNEDSVQLLTCHSAKGLEWNVVMIIGAEDGKMPHYRCIDDNKQLEEERRLMYVSMTRSMECLHISYCLNRVSQYNRFKGNKCNPSRFLREAGFSV